MRKQKEWLRNEGIVYTGFWEPIHFHRQMGRDTENLDSQLEYIKSEDYIKHLSEIGVNQLWSNFSKGYGLTFEDEEQKKIKDLCEIAHRYNMRVIAYCTGGTLAPETLRYDVTDPTEVDDWLAHTEDGKLASYGNNGYQCFRARPCYTSPGYMEWQKKVIKKALDFGCDGIHFDNTNILPEPASCKCPRCVAGYKAYLQKKYGADDPETKKAGLHGWGRNDFQFAKEPWHDLWNPPVLQREAVISNQRDWFLYRQSIFASALNEWADYIHDLGGIVEYNFGKGFNQNYRMFGGIDDEKVWPKADIVFNEGTLHLGYNKKGSPHTRVRSHKIGQAFSVPIMMYNRSTHEMAEAFSFNPGMCSLWQIGQKPENHPDSLKFIKFYHQYKHYQTRQSSVAQIGIFLENESMTNSQLKTLMTLCSFIQLLQEECLPFNLIYNKDLDHLDQYKLIVIADMPCVKERQASAVSKWVQSGGSLLTIGSTGIRDDYFRLRRKIKSVKTIDDLYRCNEPETVFTALTGEDNTKDYVASIGSGKIAHLTALEYEDSPRPGDLAEWNIRSELINCPLNSDKVSDILSQLLPKRNLVVHSDQDLLVDIARRDDTGEGIIHLFNISFARGQYASASVVFRWTEPVKTLTWIGYDRNETPVEFKKTDDAYSFALDGIKESAVIVINKK
ncbi:MAG: hypothetical protein ABIH86_04415 [Planctomycetota bacterium]